MATGPTAKRFVISASKEVILSAGSLNTPQILMLSGIGDSFVLERLGIRPIVHLPDVGKNLQDHPILSNFFVVNPDSNLSTWDDILRDSSLFNANLEQWNVSGTSVFADSPAASIGFTRLPEDAPILRKIPDPSSGSKSAHMEMIFADGFASSTQSPQPGNGSFITIDTAVVSPTSKGTVTLSSKDPFAFPVVDPALLTTGFDVLTMIQAVKDARTFIQSSTFTGLIAGRFGALGAAQTDAQITAAMRDSVTSIFHPTSTACMSPRGASWGVLDPDLRVKGVGGLRVVDASVFPNIFACHPTGVIYIIAERTSDLIKQTWGI
jgi:choline dehydrogenase-like flavoprotein